MSLLWPSALSSFAPFLLDIGRVFPVDGHYVVAAYHIFSVFLAGIAATNFSSCLPDNLSKLVYVPPMLVIFCIRIPREIVIVNLTVPLVHGLRPDSTTK